MRPADSESGDRELNGRVPRKTVHAARRQEIPRILSTAQNLKEDRDIGVDERGAVDTLRHANQCKTWPLTADGLYLVIDDNVGTSAETATG